MLPVLPECWGHRGASAEFPENTLASFEQAVRDGAEGIESDVHVSADGVVLMFHDADLSRTTLSTGKIKERNWYGPDGIQHVRTRKEPSQSIPTFPETIAFLMQPANHNITLNIDIKPSNDPTRLFTLMHATLAAHPHWQTALAPRLVLGMGHPKFLPAAKALLPLCPRAHIGFSVWLARRYFWEEVGAFSMAMPALGGVEGRRFVEECKKRDKKVMVWTVNTPDEMVEACRWGVDVVLTDYTKTWLDLREELRADYDTVSARHGQSFYWRDFRYWRPFYWFIHLVIERILERLGGPLEGHGVGEVGEGVGVVVK